MFHLPHDGVAGGTPTESRKQPNVLPFQAGEAYHQDPLSVTGYVQLLVSSCRAECAASRVASLLRSQ